MLINWVLFFIGIVLVLIRKVNIHRISEKLSWTSALFDFFFGAFSLVSKTFFLFFGYIVFAAWYFGELQFFGQPQSILPVHWTVSLFLGGGFEWLAPLVTDKLTSIVKNGFASKEIK